MEEKTKLFKMVDMDEYKTTDCNFPIIGTQALYTCFGILLYDKEKKVAVVAHISSLGMHVLKDMIELIKDNNF